MYTRLLGRESLRDEDGVKCFKDTLRPHLIKGAQSLFLWSLHQFTRARRSTIEMVKWVGNFSLVLRRLRDAWMDVLPLSTMSEERKQNQYLADVTQLNEERQKKKCYRSGFWLARDPNSQETRGHWHATKVSNHERLFQFSDNLTTLMLIVASDLSEAQRERLTRSLISPGSECYRLHPGSSEDSISGIVLYAEKLNKESFTPRERSR